MTHLERRHFYRIVQMNLVTEWRITWEMLFRILRIHASSLKMFTIRNEMVPVFPLDHFTGPERSIDKETNVDPASCDPVRAEPGENQIPSLKKFGEKAEHLTKHLEARLYRSTQSVIILLACSLVFVGVACEDQVSLDVYWYSELQKAEGCVQYRGRAPIRSATNILLDESSLRFPIPIRRQHLKSR